MVEQPAGLGADILFYERKIKDGQGPLCSAAVCCCGSTIKPLPFPEQSLGKYCFL